CCGCRLAWSTSRICGRRWSGRSRCCRRRRRHGRRNVWKPQNEPRADFHFCCRGASSPHFRRQARVSWIVHKFAGSSVPDAACFRRVLDILSTKAPSSSAAIVSACRGVTDDLYGLVALAEKRGDVEPALAALRARHAAIAEDILSAEAAQRYLAAYDADLA